MRFSRTLHYQTFNHQSKTEVTACEQRDLSSTDLRASAPFVKVTSTNELRSTKSYDACER